MNRKLSDIAVEKVDPRFQTRQKPSRPKLWSPGKPIADPTICDPAKIDPDFPQEVRRYFEFAQKMVKNNLRTSIEDAMSAVMERSLAHLPFAVTSPWREPPVDSEVIDVSVPVNAPITVPALSAGNPGVATVITFGPINGRMIAAITFVAQALESAAAFSDIEWEIQVEGRQVPGIPAARVQFSEITSWTPLARTVIMRGQQTLSLIARNFGAVDHFALARIGGWQWMSPSLSGTVTEQLQSTSSYAIGSPLSSGGGYP